MKCPKCRTEKADWKYCNGMCPIPTSPFYRTHMPYRVQHLPTECDLCEEALEVATTTFVTTPNAAGFEVDWQLSWLLRVHPDNQKLATYLAAKMLMFMVITDPRLDYEEWYIEQGDLAIGSTGSCKLTPNPALLLMEQDDERNARRSEQTLVIEDGRGPEHRRFQDTDGDGAVPAGDRVERANDAAGGRRSEPDTGGGDAGDEGSPRLILG